MGSREWFLAASLLLALLPTRARAAESPRRELASAGAVTLGFSASTAALTALTAWPIVRCRHDLACIGTAFVSIGGFTIAHPFLSAAAVHGLTVAVGDRQPYWHSLVGQAAGDALAVTAFMIGALRAPRRPDDRQKRRTRTLLFTTCALLSLAGPLTLRPLLDRDRRESESPQLQLGWAF